MRERDGDKRLGAAELGGELGSARRWCSSPAPSAPPCRATRRVLGEVAGLVPGVGHIEIDAESRLELVRELDIVKTPTVLVLDAEGRVVRRAFGQPRKADVIAALGEVV
ncbi:thioredoxin family protein [Streptomyces thermocoprophilus]